MRFLGWLTGHRLSGTLLGNMPQIAKGLRQAYDVQDIAFEALQSLTDSLRNGAGKLTVTKDNATSIAALVKAWESAQERIRIHRGKPMPGSMRPSDHKKRTTQRGWQGISFQEATVTTESEGGKPQGEGVGAVINASSPISTPEPTPPQPNPIQEPQKESFKRITVDDL